MTLLMMKIMMLRSTCARVRKNSRNRGALQNSRNRGAPRPLPPANPSASLATPCN